MSTQKTRRRLSSSSIMMIYIFCHQFAALIAGSYRTPFPAAGTIIHIFLLAIMSLVDRYNALLCHRSASANFQDQLRKSFPEVQDCREALKLLLTDLAPLFQVSDKETPTYAVWLLHGHYHLKGRDNHSDGERMLQVSRRGDKCDISHPPGTVPERCYIMQPTTDTSPRIVPERWNNIGEEMEYRFLADDDKLPPPPPPALWDGFKKIMQGRQIDMLGVCYAPDEAVLEDIKNGSLFLETTGHGDRMHHTTLTRAVDPEFITETAWIPRDFTNATTADAGTLISTMISLPVTDALRFSTTAPSAFSVDGCTHSCGGIGAGGQSCPSFK